MAVLPCILLSVLTIMAWCPHRCRPSLKDPAADIDHVSMAVMAVGVSSAMAFLERKRVIHRDVAARNVLVRDQWHRVSVHRP